MRCCSGTRAASAGARARRRRAGSSPAAALRSAKRSRHRLGQAVRREQDRRAERALGLGQRVERGFDAVRHRRDEARMVEADAQLVDLRRVRHQALHGLVEILAVLAAAAVRAERARHVRERAAHSGVRHLRDACRQQRMPVAIAPVDRQRGAVRVELVLQRLDQRARVPVDRAHAAELLVAFRDVRFRLRRHAQPAEHVVEERQRRRPAPRGRRTTRRAARRIRARVNLRLRALPRDLADEERARGCPGIATSAPSCASPARWPIADAASARAAPR